MLADFDVLLNGFNERTSVNKFLPTAGLAMALTLLPFAASAQDTIKIGLVQPLTGSVAYNGMASVNGSKLAPSRGEVE